MLEIWGEGLLRLGGGGSGREWKVHERGSGEKEGKIGGCMVKVREGWREGGNKRRMTLDGKERGEKEQGRNYHEATEAIASSLKLKKLFFLCES